MQRDVVCQYALYPVMDHIFMHGAQCLTNEQQDVLRLRFEHGMSYAKVCTTLNLSNRMAAYRITKRAASILNDHMKQYGCTSETLL